MAWCHQATSHYLNQWWPRSLPPYGVTRPQWIKSLPRSPLGTDADRAGGSNVSSNVLTRLRIACSSLRMCLTSSPSRGRGKLLTGKSQRNLQSNPIIKNPQKHVQFLNHIKNQCYIIFQSFTDSEIAASCVIYPLNLKRDSSATNYQRPGDTSWNLRRIKTSMIGPIPSVLGPIRIMARGPRDP